MKTVIRGGGGLGDSLYVQAIVRHLLKQGRDDLIVGTNYPEVFSQLDVETRPLIKAIGKIVAHYTSRKGVPGTSQFEDCCIRAGIEGPVELVLDWKPVNKVLISKLKSHGRPILLVSMPRSPMGRDDGFAHELMPKKEAYQAVLDMLKPHFLLVQVGSGKAMFNLQGIDVDLADKTTVSDLIDIASVSDGLFGTCSFLIPLAESLDKPGLFLWSRRGLNSKNVFIRTITPEKVLHKHTSLAVIDDSDRIPETVDAFLRQVVCSKGAGRKTRCSGR
jgi:hypothetical protein